MKKYIISLLSAVALIGFTSCDGTQEEPHIQWFPSVTIDGPSEVLLAIGEDFSIPSFTAVNTLTGEDASSAVSISIYDVLSGQYVRTVSTDSPGIYYIYYDSPASEVQLSSDYTVYKQVSVIVYDPSVTTDISGTWMVNVDNSYRVRYSGSNAGQSYTFAEVAAANGNDVSDGIPVTISQVAPGFFYVDDLDAGLVTELYGYAAAYPSYNFQMHAYISLNEDNSLTLLTENFGYSYWESYYYIYDFDGEYDPDEGVIKYQADIAYYGFYLDVVLEQP